MDQGGKLQGRAQQLAIGFTDPVELLRQDPRRVGVVFSSTSGNATNLVLRASGAIDGECAIRFPTGGVPMEFYFSRHGPLPACKWTADPVGVGIGLTVYELLYVE